MSTPAPVFLRCYFGRNLMPYDLERMSTPVPPERRHFSPLSLRGVVPTDVTEGAEMTAESEKMLMSLKIEAVRRDGILATLEVRPFGLLDMDMLRRIYT